MFQNLIHFVQYMIILQIINFRNKKNTIFYYLKMINQQYINFVGNINQLNLNYLKFYKIIKMQNKNQQMWYPQISLDQIKHFINIGRIPMVHKLIFKCKVNTRELKQDYLSILLIYIAQSKLEQKKKQSLLDILFAYKSDLDLNCRNKIGKPLIFIFCEKQQSRIVEILINKGANINTLNEEKQNILYSCVSNKSETIIKMLFQHKLNLQNQDHSKITSLLKIYKSKRHPAYEILLQQGKKILNKQQISVYENNTVEDGQKECLVKVQQNLYQQQDQDQQQDQQIPKFRLTRKNNQSALQQMYKETSEVPKIQQLSNENTQKKKNLRRIKCSQSICHRTQKIEKIKYEFKININDDGFDSQPLPFCLMKYNPQGKAQIIKKQQIQKIFSQNPELMKLLKDVESIDQAKISQIQKLNKKSFQRQSYAMINKVKEIKKLSNYSIELLKTKEKQLREKLRYNCFQSLKEVCQELLEVLLPLSRTENDESLQYIISLIRNKCKSKKRVVCNHEQQC